MSPRILVIGAGSIGTRHARNLVKAGATVKIMDPDPERAAAAGSSIPFDLDAATDHDAVVIASPTIFHAEHLRSVLQSGGHVFVEKPMVGSSTDLSAVVGHEHRIMVGHNLRFHEPIRVVHDIVQGGEIGDVVGGRFWFGSWLPDWRPNVDYRTTYSSRSDLGGGVLMDAIHEVDLALWFFGRDIDVVGAVVARLGPLEIDVEDTVRAILRRRADGVPVEISLDLLSRRYRRGIEIIGTKATARFDWDAAEIHVDSGTGRRTIAASRSLDDAYEEQMRHLVEWISGGPAPPVDGFGGSDSVRLSDEIKQRSWPSVL